MKRHGNRVSARRARPLAMRLGGRKSASASKSAAQTQRIGWGQSHNALAGRSDPAQAVHRRPRACSMGGWAAAALWFALGSVPRAMAGLAFRVTRFAGFRTPLVHERPQELTRRGLALRSWHSRLC